MTSRNAQTLLREVMQTGGLVAEEVLDPVELAKSFRLDMNEIMIAMANLEAFGLLERLGDSRRYRVRRPSSDELYRFMRMRLDIETRVASTLAISATKTEIETLRAAIAEQRQAAIDNEPVRFLAESAKFHQLLATTANFLHGARVLRTWEDYQQVIGMRALDKPHAMLEAVHEHEDLLQHIETRNSEAASESMRQHLERTMSRMRVFSAS